MLIKIPTPQYIVFYNGEDDCDPVTKLRLSDAFINKDNSGDFEWTATVYNLNRGKNDDLLERCKPLSDYMELVNRIRDNQRKGMNVRNAIDDAVDSCIADGIMKDFLVKHKAEVLSVCITEFDEKVYTDSIREEGREEGRAEGREEGIKALIIDNLEEGKSKKIIIGKLVKRFELQEKAAIEYFDRFADNSVSKL